MKKIAIALVCFCVFVISAFAQSNRSKRPRVVTTPTPSATTDDSSTQTDGKRPPVLIGDTESKPTGEKRQPVFNDRNQKDQTITGKDEEVIAEEDDDVIRIETNLVTMPVSVLDRDGRFVSGLQQRDFQIFEDGVQQKVEYFQSVEQPFTVILLIDVSPSTQFKMDEIQNAAITFVNQLRRDDRVMVVSFDERVHVLSPVTSDRNVLQNAIRQARFGDGTSLYEAVDQVISRHLKQIQGRKAVVLFTDGVDTTSRRANYQSTIQQTEEVDALFYPIRYDTSDDMNGSGTVSNYPYPRRRGRSGGGILGTILDDILNGGTVTVGGNTRRRGPAGSSSAEYETGRKYLESLAQNSGGRKFEADSTYNLDAAFSGIAEELRRQYSIGYYPEKAGQKGERRQIRVRVMRPNVVVRAKNSYIVGAGDKFAGK